MLVTDPSGWPADSNKGGTTPGSSKPASKPINLFPRRRSESTVLPIAVIRGGGGSCTLYARYIMVAMLFRWASVTGRWRELSDRSCTDRDNLRIAFRSHAPCACDPRRATGAGAGERDVATSVCDVAGSPAKHRTDDRRDSKILPDRCTGHTDLRTNRSGNTECGWDIARDDEREALASAMPWHGVNMSRLNETIRVFHRQIGPHDSEILSIRFVVSMLALAIPPLAVPMDAIPDKISTLGDQIDPMVDEISPHSAPMAGQIREMLALPRPMRAIRVAIRSDREPASPLAVPISAVATPMLPLTQPIGPQLVAISCLRLCLR